MKISVVCNSYWLAIVASCFFSACSFGQTSDVSVQEELPSLWTRKNGDDWPQFLGLKQTGASNETGILKDWSDGKLKQVWSIKTGQGYSIGSVARGRYFHFDCDGDVARLRCIAAETGKQLWEYKYPSTYDDMYGFDSGPRTSPVIDGSRVYVLGVEGVLTCINADKGTEVWKVNLAERFGVIQNFFGVGSTPVVHKDNLLVMVGGSGGKAGEVSANQFPEIKPDNSGLVAFDKLTGKVKFTAVDDLASYSSIKLATIAGKDVALVWARSALHGVDPENGKSLFEFDYRARILESVNASTPVVKGDHVFLSECYGLGSVLLKFENEKLETVWSDAGRREKALATHWNTPVVYEDHLYASSGRKSGDAELRCIELKTGKVKWSERGFSRASATLIDGHLLVLGEYGQMILVRATPEMFVKVTELKTTDETKLNYPCWSAPIVSHGLMFVRGKRKVVCYDLISE